VSSDRENREFAGKLNDPGKNGKLPGISRKEGKTGNFHSIILFLNKIIAKSVFAFFSRKKQNPFLF